MVINLCYISRYPVRYKLPHSKQFMCECLCVCMAMAVGCNFRTRFASIWLFHGNVPFHQRRKRYIFHFASRSALTHPFTIHTKPYNQFCNTPSLSNGIYDHDQVWRFTTRPSHWMRTRAHSPKEKLWNTMWTAVVLAVLLMHYSLSLSPSLFVCVTLMNAAAYQMVDITILYSIFVQ